jgi:hypothetical protein
LIYFLGEMANQIRPPGPACRGNGATLQGVVGERGQTVAEETGVDIDIRRISCPNY